jgi:flagellar biosynthesis/type III secretory pathway protein FliH
MSKPEKKSIHLKFTEAKTAFCKTWKVDEKSAYQRGYEDGYEKGRAEGYVEGEIDGFNNGRNWGNE